MIIRCPLCHSDQSETIGRVKIADLDLLYRRIFDLPVREEFGELEELVFRSCPECSLRFFWPPVAGSRNFYLGLNRHAWYYVEEKSEYSTAASLIERGSSVLDIGCGEGKFAAHLPGRRYVGLEMNLAEARVSADRSVTIVPEAVEAHAAIHREEYDVVTTFQVLEHVVDVSGFIEAAIGSLRPGGLLIISVPSADSYIAETVNGVLNMPPHHLSWWPDASLEYLAQRYGLSLVALRHEGLERIHFRRYAYNRALSTLHALMGVERRLIDRSFRYRLLALLSLPIAAWRLLLLRRSAKSIAGHSVIAVYRKGE